MDNLQEMIQFYIDNQTVINSIISALLGGGILWKLLPKLYDLYRKRYSFSIEMAMINKKNKLLAKKEGIYVARPELEAALNIKYETCVIVGPAGSGKTRFALNLIKNNRLFSKYYYVYIHKNNAQYFDSEEFKNLRWINSRRNYIFIIDYVYENVELIYKLKDWSKQTKRNKFILLERDYSGLDFPEAHEISMQDYRMDTDSLCQIFLNELPRRQRKSKEIKEKAKKIIDLIYNQFDQDDIRPIFAKLTSSIFIDNPDYDEKLLGEIKDYSDLIELYWNHKFYKKNVEDKCKNSDLHVDEEFMSNLNIVIRSLSLVAGVTKKDVVLECRNSRLTCLLGGERDITSLLDAYCEGDFLEKFGKLSIENIREILGIVLKDSIRWDKKARKNKFRITANLDIISEWVMKDSLLLYKNEHWINDLQLFLRKNYHKELCKFMARAALDFSELTQYFEQATGRNIRENEYLAHIFFLIKIIYETKSEKARRAKIMQLAEFIKNTKSDDLQYYRTIEGEIWKILRRLFSENLTECNVTKAIMKIFEGEKDEQY